MADRENVINTKNSPHFARNVCNKERPTRELDETRDLDTILKKLFTYWAEQFLLSYEKSIFENSKRL